MCAACPDAREEIKEGMAFMTDYITEEIVQYYKVCPLDGKPAPHFTCDMYDCSGVFPGESFAFDYRGRTETAVCPYDMEDRKGTIDNRIAREEARKRQYQRICHSLEDSCNWKSGYLGEFFDYCGELDKTLRENGASYQDLNIRPYHEGDEIFLIYYMEYGNPVSIRVSESLLSEINKYITRVRDNDYSTISYLIIPKEYASEIRIYLYLKYDMDISTVLKIDNKVYLKEHDLYKWMGAAYGFTVWDVKKLREKHLELTEIVTSAGIVFIKQELNEMVARESRVNSAKLAGAGRHDV